MVAVLLDLGLDREREGRNEDDEKTLHARHYGLRYSGLLRSSRSTSSCVHLSRRTRST
jgi:hypothetical protein